MAYFANAVLPARVGEVARTLLVARREQLPVALVAATVIIERVLDLAALLTLGLAAAAALGASRPPSAGRRSRLGVVLVSGLAVVARFAGAIGRQLPVGSDRWRATRRSNSSTPWAEVGARTSLLAYGLSALAWMGDVGRRAGSARVRWEST